MRIHRAARVLWIVIAMTFLSVPVAQGSYIIVMSQVGASVVATGSGSLDTTDLTFAITSSGSPAIIPDDAFAFIGPASTVMASLYLGVTGPASFGSGSGKLADTGSGNIVGVEGNMDAIGVPVGYVSGSDLGTSTDIYINQSFASLGLNTGTYTYTWGTGPDADTFTVNVGPVPEPTTLSLLAFAAMALFPRRPRAT